MNTRLLLRITAPFMATSLLLLAFGVGAAYYVHRLQQSVSTELRTHISGVRAGEELEILVLQIRTQLDNFIITNGDPKYLDAVDGLKEKTERWLSEAEHLSVTPRKQDLMTQARGGYKRLLVDLPQLKGKPWDGSLSSVVHDMIKRITKDMEQPAQEFLDANEDEVDKSMEADQVFADRLAYGLLLLGMCGSGAGLLVGFGLARGINRRLVQLSVPIRNAAGRLDEVVGPITFDASADLEQIETVLHQMSERIGAIIDRLRQSERQVMQAEHLASVGQMAAGMAHELRNPLTSMKILVQAAEDAATGLTGRDLIVLEDEITRLERLVQSFVEFARPPQIEKRTLDVAPLVEQAVALFTARAAQTGTRIHLDSPSQPILAALDPAQFRQVLLNLLINALEASRPGGAIDVRLTNGPDGCFTCKVADRGHGLPADLGEQIFAPFVTTKENGLGLGLSVCKRIAEAHGGDVSAANRPGGGAEFSISLPVVRDQV